VKPPTLAEALVQVTETVSSLKANRFVSSIQVWGDRRQDWAPLPLLHKGLASCGPFLQLRFSNAAALRHYGLVLGH
jgi:hypothetical protein